MKYVFFDTETTGLQPSQGHRIIELAGVAVTERSLEKAEHFHVYLHPGAQKIDPGAVAVHGITEAFLADKPAFSAIADEWLAFVEGAELIAHNAPFDMGFLTSELARIGKQPHDYTWKTVTDTLVLARKKHPGQKNSLDKLCERYAVDNSNRQLHGALKDALLLARVYFAMTGGQTHFAWQAGAQPATIPAHSTPTADPLSTRVRRSGKVMRADAAEAEAHRAWCEAQREASLSG